MGYTNINKNPLDKIADIAGAIAGKRKKKRELERKLRNATPKAIANKVVDAAASKAGVTRGTCKHKGVKRGSICPGCSSKIM